MNFIICCKANRETGGPEALHQLASELHSGGGAKELVRIFYYQKGAHRIGFDQKKNAHYLIADINDYRTPPRYSFCSVEITAAVQINNESIFIVPETEPGLASTIAHLGGQSRPLVAIS